MNVTIHLSRDGKALGDAPLLWLIEGHSSIYGYHRGKTDANGNLVVQTSLKQPGFIRILAIFKSPEAGEKEVQARIGIGVEPEKITTSRPKPADFDSYWDSEIAAMKKMPLQAEVSRVEVSNPNYKDRVDMYDVKINTPGDQPFVYGYLYSAECGAEIASDHDVLSGSGIPEFKSDTFSCFARPDGA